MRRLEEASAHTLLALVLSAPGKEMSVNELRHAAGLPHTLCSSLARPGQRSGRQGDGPHVLETVAARGASVQRHSSSGLREHTVRPLRV